MQLCKQLILTLLIGCAPLVYTPTTYTKNNNADAVISASIITIGAGIIAWGWKVIAESSKREQLATDKQSLVDVQHYDANKDFGAILSLINSHGDARSALADYLLFKNTSIDAFNDDLKKYYHNAREKSALLKINIINWTHKSSRSNLRQQAQILHQKSENQLKLVESLDNFCKKNYAFMKLYQAYKRVKNSNYYNPNDTFQYIHAAEQMNCNYTILKKLITPLDYQTLDFGFQQLYRQVNQELDELGSKRKRLVTSREYKNEIFLQEQVKQQEKNRELLQEKNNIEQQKANAQERKARAQELEICELRKQNQIQSEKNSLESERRSREHIFAPEFRQYENKIRTLKNQIDTLLEENSLIKQSRNTFKNNVRVKNDEIAQLKHQIAALLNQIESDEETEDNKKLKLEVLALQSSINNPPYNPSSEAYAHWLTKKVSDLGKKQ